MADNEEVLVEEEHHEEKKKGALGKLKDALLPDPDEQAAIFSTFVRLGVLVWSGGILTLNYVAIPGIPQQKIDPTFIASVFTGVLASFGIQTASKKNGAGNGVGKNGGPTQTIVIEQAPLRIIADTPKKDEEKYTL